MIPLLEHSWRVSSILLPFALAAERSYSRRARSFSRAVVSNRLFLSLCSQENAEPSTGRPKRSNAGKDSRDKEAAGEIKSQAACGKALGRKRKREYKEDRAVKRRKEAANKKEVAKNIKEHRDALSAASATAPVTDIVTQGVPVDAQLWYTAVVGSGLHSLARSESARGLAKTQNTS